MSIHNKLYRLTLYQVEPIARQYNLEANVSLLEELNRSFPNVGSIGVATREIHQWMKNKVANQRPVVNHKPTSKVVVPPPPQRTQTKTTKRRAKKKTQENHTTRGLDEQE